MEHVYSDIVVLTLFFLSNHSLQEKVDMMTVLAGILSLGNIVFEPSESDALRVAESARGWLKASAVSSNAGLPAFFIGQFTEQCRLM